MRKLLLATVASLSTILAAGAAHAQAVTPVAPGSIRVHLNGYLQFDVGTMGGTGMSGGSGATAYKKNAIDTSGDVRLYPGFDGMTVDGLGYGAQIELRTTTANANGSGVNSNSTSDNGFDGIYVRRAYGYLGTTDYGYVRFGQTDSAFSLLQRGVIEAFGDGGQFNDDGGPVTMLPSAPGQFIYADQGALYTTNKIVYISPSIEDPLLNGKLSVSMGFEPNSNGIKEGYANTGSCYAANVVSTGCAANLNARRRNTFDGMIDYSVVFGNITTKASVGYLDAQPVAYTGEPLAAAPYGYASMGVVQAGIQTSIKGLATDSDSITLGANVKSGSVEDGYKFKPRGARNALAYIVGAAYDNGPYTVGGSFFDSQSANGVGTDGGHTLSEYGAAAGANYAIAKPMSLWLEYLYGSQHTATTDDHSQVLALGATIKW